MDVEIAFQLHQAECELGVDPLFTMYTTPGFTDEKIHLFMATGLVVGATQHEADEFLDLEPMLLSRALELVETGEIKDAKTITSLLLWEKLRDAAG